MGSALRRAAGGGLSPSLVERRGTGVAVGGTVGALIGILAGPVGVLLGWSTGMLVGIARPTNSPMPTTAYDLEPQHSRRHRRPHRRMTETSHAIAEHCATTIGDLLER